MQKKFKTQYNAEQFPDDGEINNQPSMTVPDMSLSIRQLMDRYARGLPISMKKGEYDEYDPEDEFYSVDFSNMDLAEKEEVARLAGEEVQRLRSVLNEKTIAAQAEKERLAKEEQMKIWQEMQKKQMQEENPAEKLKAFYLMQQSRKTQSQIEQEGKNYPGTNNP